MAKKERLQLPYVAGEKGINRVRLFARARDGAMYLEFFPLPGRRRTTHSIGGLDPAEGKRAADRLAAELLLQSAAEAPPAQMTLRRLLDTYEAEALGRISSNRQRHAKSANEMFLACWGANTLLTDLDQRDWDRFIAERHEGSLKPRKSKRTTGVGERMIAMDLVHLKSVCTWATRVRVHGKPLLPFNPFLGYRIPNATTPKRPAISDEDYAALVAVAPDVDARCLLFLLLAHSTGHRKSAIAHLRWSDFNLKAGEVTWRAEFDKKRQEHTIPLSPRTITVVRESQRSFGGIGEAWVFPSPSDTTQAIDVDLLQSWWERLETLAGISHVPGRAWHCLRRKFATEHQDLPLPELMALGGWKDHNTLLKCYPKPRQEKLREALARREAASV